MKVGIPKGLLYYKYYPFIKRFLSELGVEIITSTDTNKNILNEGIKYCVDEACLPIKIFHGHILDIKDKCDLLIIPRFMRVREREFICPKFCGLPEMILCSIPNMPKVMTEPIYATSEKELYTWCKNLANMITKDKRKTKVAFNNALVEQRKTKFGIKDEGYKITIALVGHPYNLYDTFINMDIVKKLNKLGVGVITEEYVSEEQIKSEVNTLFKRPFWTFASNSYGFTTSISKNKEIDGAIYISSFACGIDSVVIELIKDKLCGFPLLVLKVDEHTGEGGIDTRIEAFIDMIERKNKNEDNISTFRQHTSCS
ncbi:acyl-CoA dehydratase activase-related protein [Clostridium estertheticum]|uniref:acyl-CoA dehydratase activase-related protein n=1 Tax=Clostridium estertheticum TaxID=238834 RepID=UPI001CF24FBA|nr:acyl-CoA dehydratase activase-related protein [Clostridium estertheticum]MCB2308548.1 acyl-CoA dehydratase activase-related protein [Clostridium estertheticum]MCB2346956.1 acyl-CoA dehydratase activase-related protein [Clostridium estertheticum]MCB2351496.1 acyl-CoA dehydratase activase-related protein [Clostridium estertheticum]WAG46579.1 acyl-CoA dehydratase activase-related protein [Clostridium estertheticum]